MIRKARESGEPSYFNRAEEALQKALAIAPQNAGALRHLAYVFYSRHEFAPAAVQARRALEINSEDGDAYGILGDALLEVGRYAEAEAAYDHMVQLEQSLYSYSRLAGLKSTRGDSAGAIADLERAVALGKQQNSRARASPRAEWQLGMEHFAIGDLLKAESCYRQSLQTYPNYYRALAGMAQLRTAQKSYDEAIDFYQKAIAILPMPRLCRGAGRHLREDGARRASASTVCAGQRYIGRLNEINKVLYNRELAYFYADHDLKLNVGLELAQRELDYRRDIYAYDLLAWNLYKNGRLDEARAAIEEALKLGTKDAKLFFHAGMIYSSFGREGESYRISFSRTQHQSQFSSRL